MQKQKLQLRFYLPKHFFILVALEQMMLMLLDIQFKFDSVQFSVWETSVIIWTGAVMAYVLLSPNDSIPSPTAFWQSVSARVSSAHY